MSVVKGVKGSAKGRIEKLSARISSLGLPAALNVGTQSEVDGLNPAREPLLATLDPFGMAVMPKPQAKLPPLLETATAHAKSGEQESVAVSEAPLAGFSYPALLVQPAWVQREVPAIVELDVFETEVSDGVITRLLRARVDLFDGDLTEREVTVTYEAPAADESSADTAARLKRDRRQEEGALRELDGVAAVEHRHQKAKERQEARAIKTAVTQTVESLIDEVEKQVNAWLPADGPDHLRTGDWAWIPPKDGVGPLLVRIDARYQNGVVDVMLLDAAASDTASARLSKAEGARLLPLDARSPRFIGERVRVRGRTDFGTDLYIESIYAPRTGYTAECSLSSLDRVWDMRGLDGYCNGLCDLATIERLTPKSADVVLFNPCTMEYDGQRFTGVPLNCVSGLNYAVPLAESRAGALGLLAPIASTTARHDDEISTVLSELIETLCDQEGESTEASLKHWFGGHLSNAQLSSLPGVMRTEAWRNERLRYQLNASGGKLYRADSAHVGADSWRLLKILERIDLATDPSTIAACVVELNGPPSVVRAIESRQQLCTALLTMQQRVQSQWMLQEGERRERTAMEAGAVCIVTESELTQSLQDAITRSRYSRHLADSPFTNLGAEETIASICLLHGEQQASVALDPNATLQTLQNKLGGWLHPSVCRWHGSAVRWWHGGSYSERWHQQEPGGGWFYRPYEYCWSTTMREYGYGFPWITGGCHTLVQGSDSESSSSSISRSSDTDSEKSDDEEADEGLAMRFDVLATWDDDDGSTPSESDSASAEEDVDALGSLPSGCLTSLYREEESEWDEV